MYHLRQQHELQLDLGYVCHVKYFMGKYFLENSCICFL
jgi:hypothetical protein